MFTSFHHHSGTYFQVFSTNKWWRHSIPSHVHRINTYMSNCWKLYVLRCRYAETWGSELPQDPPFWKQVCCGDFDLWAMKNMNLWRSSRSSALPFTQCLSSFVPVSFFTCIFKNMWNCLFCTEVYLSVHVSYAILWILGLIKAHIAHKNKTRLTIVILAYIDAQSV